MTTTPWRMGGSVVGFLVRCPEPIDRNRTRLEVLRADRRAPAPQVPTAIKLTAVAFGTAAPNEESVELLRRAVDLSGYRIFPGPVTEPVDDPVLLVDEFKGPAKGVLVDESLATAARSDAR